MNLQQAIKTLVTAKAYIGMSNWFFNKGDQTKASNSNVLESFKMIN